MMETRVECTCCLIAYVPDKGVVNYDAGGKDIDALGGGCATSETYEKVYEKGAGDVTQGDQSA